MPDFRAAKALTDLLLRCGRDEEGASIIEYGVLVAMLCVLVLYGYESTGQSLVNLFGFFTNAFNNAVS